MRITKRWTETEHSLMRQHYSLPDGVEFLMSALKRDRPSLWIKAQRLGLTHYVYILRGGKADKRKLAITVENLKMNTIIDLNVFQINHHCDVRNCINPSHLYAGNQADNIQDCVRRGRHRWNKITV